MCFLKKGTDARCGGAALYSQHSEDRGKRISVSSRTARSTHRNPRGSSSCLRPPTPARVTGAAPVQGRHPHSSCQRPPSPPLLTGAAPETAIPGSRSREQLPPRGPASAGQIPSAETGQRPPPRPPCRLRGLHIVSRPSSAREPAGWGRAGSRPSGLSAPRPEPP